MTQKKGEKIVKKLKILLDKITHLVILSIDDEHKRRKK